MPTVDAMIARLESELEERNHFVEGLVAGAQDGNRGPQLPGNRGIDRERPGSASPPSARSSPRCAETSRITIESPRNRMREMDDEMAGHAPTGRRARHRVPLGGRLCGRVVLRGHRRRRGRRAPRGVQPGRHAPDHGRQPGPPARVGRHARRQLRRRGDRPLVGVIAPIDLGTGSWSYARVTQHTQVAKQTGEKTELAHRAI